MDNQNDVALANTINRRGLRVGETNVGAFVGSTLVAGKEFDIKQLLNNITISDSFVNSGNNVGRILIVNLSDNDYTVLYRNAQRTAIPKQHIEWYSYNIGEEIYLANESNTVVRGLIQYFRIIGSNINISYTDSTYGNDDVITDDIIKANQNFNVVCVLMNA